MSFPQKPDVMWSIHSDGKAQRYVIKGGDEFSGGSPDYEYWRNDFPWGRNLYCNKEQQYYTDHKNFECGNGILSIIARKENINAKIMDDKPDDEILTCGTTPAIKNKQPFNYTSGMLYSRTPYKHGIFEIRFKLPEGRGLWPAFWLYGGNPNEEIDIFEGKGEKSKALHIDVHCPDGCDRFAEKKRGFGGWIGFNETTAAGFNTMMLEWSPDWCTWHVNGQKAGDYAGTFNHPAHVIVNLAIAGDKPAAFNPGPDEKTSFPAVMQIDYVRVWQPDATAQPVILKQSGGRTASPAADNGSLTIRKRGKQTKTPAAWLKKTNRSPVPSSFRIYFHVSGGELTLETEGAEALRPAFTWKNEQGKDVVVSETRSGNLIRFDATTLPKGKYKLTGGGMAETVVVE